MSSSILENRENGSIRQAHSAAQRQCSTMQESNSTLRSYVDIEKIHVLFTSEGQARINSKQNCATNSKIYQAIISQVMRVHFSSSARHIPSSPPHSLLLSDTACNYRITYHGHAASNTEHRALGSTLDQEQMGKATVRM